MNISQHIPMMAVGGWSADREIGSGAQIAESCRGTSFFLRMFQRAFRACFAPAKRRSIVRSQTNLPAFLVVALSLAILCNVALRQSNAEASRLLSGNATIQQVLAQVRLHPEDYELHSRLGELYFQNHQYRRAMFHLSEASRLLERYGE